MTKKASQVSASLAEAASHEGKQSLCIAYPIGPHRDLIGARFFSITGVIEPTVDMTDMLLTQTSTCLFVSSGTCSLRIYNVLQEFKPHYVLQGSKGDTLPVHPSAYGEMGLVPPFYRNTS